MKQKRIIDMRIKTPRLLTSLALILALFVSITPRTTASSGSSSSHASKISSDLKVKGQDQVRVILQLSDKPSGELNALLNRNGVHIRAHFKNFNSYAIELPASVVAELSDFDEVAYISSDRATQSLGHVSLTTGADAVRQQTSTSLLGGTTSYALDGTGIG